MASFGEEHRRLRLAKTDCTHREYAKRLGVSASYVSNVEKGQEAPFSKQLLRKSFRLMQLSYQEQARLFSLRNEGAKKAKVERAAYQLARKTSHLTEQEFHEIVEQARELVLKERSST